MSKFRVRKKVWNREGWKHFSKTGISRKVAGTLMQVACEHGAYSGAIAMVIERIKEMEAFDIEPNKKETEGLVRACQEVWNAGEPERKARREAVEQERIEKYSKTMKSFLEFKMQEYIDDEYEWFEDPERYDYEKVKHLTEQDFNDLFPGKEWKTWKIIKQEQ